MLKSNLKVIVFVVVLLLLPYVLLAIGERSDPFTVNTSQAYKQPSMENILGTDSLGRNMFARTVYASGLSLKVVMQSVLISFLLALFLGCLSGYTAGSWIDLGITWIIALLYTIPFILIVIAVFTVINPGIENAYLIIGCIGWSGPARLVRAEVMQIKTSQFVLAERAFGFSSSFILFRSILPLSFTPALISLLYYIPELIGIEVGLSFFGLGTQPPIPSLGSLIYEGVSLFYVGWWLAVIPATILLIMMAGLYIITASLSSAKS